ncbi:hypothetical protein L596_013629 [Steinernema carpocapsae]|uniref:Uncharacterized protein n=1 Tax=Steinernema carpocapsae TaxID=34508 RepID=A0A4U5P1L0_STECR|nr:hypothetical protein L596_013629 [Steinernema carpocapsae]
MAVSPSRVFFLLRSHFEEKCREIEASKEFTSTEVELVLQIFEQVKNAAYIPPEDGLEFAEDSLDETDQENEESEYEDDISTGDKSASSGFANYNEKDIETILELHNKYELKRVSQRFKKVKTSKDISRIKERMSSSKTTTLRRKDLKIELLAMFRSWMAEKQVVKNRDIQCAAQILAK